MKRTEEEIVACSKYYPFKGEWKRGLDVFAKEILFDDEDLSQEYALMCLEHPDYFDEQPWYIARLLRGRIHRRARVWTKGKRDKKRDVSGARFDAWTSGDPSGSARRKTQKPDDIASFNELKTRVCNLIEQYFDEARSKNKERDVEFVRRVVFDGALNEEIAVEVGMTRARVWQLVNPCLHFLQKELAELAPPTKSKYLSNKSGRVNHAKAWLEYLKTKENK